MTEEKPDAVAPGEWMCKLGRLLDGFQRDGGVVAHWVKQETSTHGMASCGTRPREHSVGWGSAEHSSRNCPRCIHRLEREFGSLKPRRVLVSAPGSIVVRSAVSAK